MHFRSILGEEKIPYSAASASAGKVAQIGIPEFCISRIPKV
jgi:hypothetical protein